MSLSHFFTIVYQFSNVCLMSLQRLRVVQTNGHCWSHRQKHFKEDKQGKANLAFRVRANECPNEKISLSATYAYGYNFL